MHTSRQRANNGARAIATFLLCAAAPSWSALGAQSTPPPDTTRAILGAVVISATRTSTTTGNVPLHVSVITRAELAASPAQTLDQVLRAVPGMNLSGAPYYATDPTSHQTKLRGVTNSKVLVLVDGVPIHDPFYSTTQWFKVPLSSIERVEVLQGGASSLWGNLAVAGVVNIITRKPIDNGGQLDLSYQSLNTAVASVARNFTFSNGLAIRASGDLLRTDGYQTTPDAFLARVPGKGPSSARNGNAQIAAYFNPAGSLSGFARFGYHQQTEDIGGYRYGDNVQKSPDAAIGLTEHFSDDVRADVRAWGQYETFDKDNGAACYLDATAGCNTTSTTSPLVQYANSRDDNPYHEIGASGILSFDNVTRLLPSVQVGLDFRSVGGEDRATTYNPPTTPDVASATINHTNFGRGTQRFVALFGQIRVAPLPRLEATASLRYDDWTNTGGVSELTNYSGGAPGATTGGPIADSHQGSLNPSIGLRFDASDHLSLRAAAYRGFRAPGLNNLYRSFSSTTFITIANPTLSPETLTGAEAGADLHVGALTAGATYFDYHIKSLIASYRIPSAAEAPAAVTDICGPTLSNCPPTVNYNTNDQNGVSRGVELTANWRASRSFALDGGYTYTHSVYTFSTTGDPIDAQLGGVAPHLVTLGIDWQATPRWNLVAGARYNSAMFLDVNHTISQPAFTLLDASTSYQINSRFEVYGSATNLGDVQYSDTPTTSAANETLALGRALTSGIRVHF